MMLKINCIQHIGMPVTDLEVSETFYGKLGFINVMASEFEYREGNGKVAMMRRGEMILELYQMPERELQEIRQRKDGRIDHIAFDVENIEEAFTTLKNASFSIVEAEPVFLPFWNDGCKYFNVLGPDNERLEFNQIL